MKLCFKIILLTLCCFGIFQHVHAQTDDPAAAPAAFAIDYNFNVICLGDAAVLSAVVDSNVESNPIFRWNTGETSTTITVTPVISTVYHVSVYSSTSQFLGQVSCLINVGTRPAVLPLHDTICLDEEATVGMISSAKYYYWNTGGTTDTINTYPKVTTIYTVSASDFPVHHVDYINNCYAFDSARAFVYTEPAYTIQGDSIACKGYETHLTIVDAREIVWDNGDTTTEVTLTLTTDSLLFSVIATDRHGCRGTKSIKLRSIDGPEGAIFALHDTICKGASTLLYATGGKSYEWSSYEYGDTIIISPRETITLFVDVYAGENQTLCYSRYYKEIAVENCDKIFFPSAITLSGTNRVFKPIGVSYPYNEYRLYIYNKWGQLIFESNDFDLGWTGQHKGENVQPGVYVFKFTVTNKRDVWTKTGTVTVID